MQCLVQQATTASKPLVRPGAPSTSAGKGHLTSDSTWGVHLFPFVGQHATARGVFEQGWTLVEIHCTTKIYCFLKLFQALGQPWAQLRRHTNRIPRFDLFPHLMASFQFLLPEAPSNCRPTCLKLGRKPCLDLPGLAAQKPTTSAGQLTRPGSLRSCFESFELTSSVISTHLGLRQDVIRYLKCLSGPDLPQQTLTSHLPSVDILYP